MKTENIIWGMILIFLGGILLLDNFDIINFYWTNVWRLWPLILIVSGVNIIFSSNRSKFAPVIIILINLIALGIVAYYGTQPRMGWRAWSFSGDFNDNSDNRDNGSDGNFRGRSSFSEPYKGVPRARLNITGGATVYDLNDTTSNLFDAEVNQKWGNYSLQKISQDSIEILNFKLSSHRKHWNTDDADGNRAKLRINKNPLWDIYLETGAGEANFDLSPFKVNSLQIKGGAASFEVKLGEPVGTTDVSAETGVAEIKINVPSSAGCRIKVESGLSSRDFGGFTQQADGSYTTANYNSSAKKINISLKGGLSDFEVNRY